MLADDANRNAIALTAANGGLFPMASGKSRLDNRFPGEPDAPRKALGAAGPIDAAAADKLGLVTQAPDGLPRHLLVERQHSARFIGLVLRRGRETCVQ